MRIAIVIPAHNEAATVGRVVQSVSPFGIVVVVDDGSTDATASLARTAGATVVSLVPSRGYEGALEAGFERAAELGADAAVTFDADGQHDAAMLPAFVGPLADGSADIVIGVRPQTARFAEALFGHYARLRYRVPDILCGLKGYRMDLYRQLGHFDSFRSVGTELALHALRHGARARLVTVHPHAREDAPRFGRALRANYRILRAMAIAAWRDIAPARKATR